MRSVARRRAAPGSRDRSLSGLPPPWAPCALPGRRVPLPSCSAPGHLPAGRQPPGPRPRAPPPLTPPTQVSCPSGSPTANAMLTTSPGGLPTPPPSSQRWPPLLAPHRAHKRTTRRRGGRRMRGNGQSRAAQVTGGGPTSLSVVTRERRPVPSASQPRRARRQSTCPAGASLGGAE